MYFELISVMYHCETVGQLHVSDNQKPMNIFCCSAFFPYMLSVFHAVEKCWKSRPTDGISLFYYRTENYSLLSKILTHAIEQNGSCI